MGLKCYYIVCVVMLSALITHSVHGFGLSDVIRELESRDAKPATREIKTPVDVIVSVALELVDANNDGEVALSEVRDLLTRYFQERRRDYGRSGYIMALAKIADVDDSGFIDQTEYQRAASLFVAETDDASVGRLLSMAINVRFGIEGFDTVVESYIPMVFRVLDRDGDGQISREERQSLLNLYQFRFWNYEVINVAERSDRNGDGNLDEAETRQWIEEAKTTYTFRNLMVYAKIASIVGKDLAETWAESLS